MDDSKNQKPQMTEKELELLASVVTGEEPGDVDLEKVMMSLEMIRNTIKELKDLEAIACKFISITTFNSFAAKREHKPSGSVSVEIAPGVIVTENKTKTVTYDPAVMEDLLVGEEGDSIRHAVELSYKVSAIKFKELNSLQQALLEEAQIVKIGSSKISCKFVDEEINKLLKRETKSTDINF